MKTISATSLLLPTLACILAPISTSAFSLNEIHSKTLTQSLASIHPSTVDEGNTLEHEQDAGNSRRSFLASAAATVAFTMANPSVSSATYGESARILIPDVVQDMADRNTKQCLVESLGTRQCLVYMDPENQLYKGSDTKLLFEKLGSCIESFKDVPIYIESKQWSKAQGVLTGPMGSLSSTMCELVKIVDDSAKSKCKALTVDIRKDLYAINLAAERKNVKDALAAFENAEVKLDKFVTLVSSS